MHIRVSLALAAGAIVMGAAGAQGETLEQFRNSRGAVVRYLVIPPVGKPRGIVVLFAGGAGKLGFGKPRDGWRLGNFLVRSRHLFARAGFAVAVPDAPSDRSRKGLLGWRGSAAHAKDIRGIVERMKQRWPARAWLVGTSRGSISAANAGARLRGIVGIVLTASVTEASRGRPGTIFDAPLVKISVPVLMVHHRRDACRVSPPAGAGQILSRLRPGPARKTLLFDGGPPSQSNPCRGRSPHGFFGIEERVVGAITRWMIASGKR